MKSTISNPLEFQEIIKKRAKLDPLLLVILGTAIILTGLTVMMYLEWGTGQPLGDTPWYIPVMHGMTGLAAFSVAFLSLGRYPVLRDPASYWIGMGFTAFGIQTIFFILTWPGLLPGGQAIIAHLPNTSGWIAVFELTVLSIFLLLAVVSRWPGNVNRRESLPGRTWLWTAFIWFAAVILTCTFLVILERYLPLLVDPTGKLTSLLLSADRVFLLLFVLGAIISAHRYHQTGDALLGHVTITQMALAFVVLTAIIGAKRYDIWYYLSRIILVGGFLILMFGLLSEYVRLFRREHEGRLMLDAILENIPIGLAATGGPPDFPLAKVSQHGLEMNRRPAEALVGLSSGEHQAAWKIYLSDGTTEPSSEQMPLYRASRLGEEIRNLEMVMETQDGKKIPVLVNAAPIRDATGQIVAAVNTWLDITERKKAEEVLQTYAKQLERTNRDLQNLTVMTSHDLQEPLRKIEAFGEAVLADSANLDAHQSDRILRMRKSAHQMRKMVNGLLQLSLLSSNTQAFQEVDLNEVTAQILAELDEEIQQSGSVVEVGKLPVIEAHPAQMQRLLQYLLENALKFQPSGGKPRVKIYAMPSTQDSVQLLVEDNGIGFDEAKAKHLFEPFERLVRKNQSEYEGVGMGLTICRWIAEHHGGEIAAHSQPGQGTTFIVTLPIRQPTISKNGAGRSLKHEN